MENPKSSAWQRLLLGLLIGCCLLFACVGFLGFLGWSGDSSNQKWWALFCSFLGITGAVVLWRSKGSMLDSTLKSADEETQLKPVEERERYWKREIRITFIQATFLSIGLLVLSEFWEFFRPFYVWCTYIWVMALWRVGRGVREVTKLKCR